MKYYLKNLGILFITLGLILSEFDFLLENNLVI